MSGDARQYCYKTLIPPPPHHSSFTRRRATTRGLNCSCRNFHVSLSLLSLCLSLCTNAHELQPTIVFFSSVLFLQQSFISLAAMAWRKLASFHGSRRFLVPVIMVFSSVFSSLLFISPVFATLSDHHHVQVVASSFSDHGSNVLALERSSSFGHLDQYSVECVLRRRRRLSAKSLQTAADVQRAPEEVRLEYISLWVCCISFSYQLPFSWVEDFHS